MDNDKLDWTVAETIDCTGETKNCYIFEPEEGDEIVSKIYIRKSAFTGKPARIRVCVEENPAD